MWHLEKYVAAFNRHKPIIIQESAMVLLTILCTNLSIKPSKSDLINWASILCKSARKSTFGFQNPFKPLRYHVVSSTRKLPLQIAESAEQGNLVCDATLKFADVFHQSEYGLHPNLRSFAI